MPAPLVAITSKPLDAIALAAAVSEDGAGLGAVTTFVGLVRDHNVGRRVLFLEYEAYDAMAQHQFHKILDQIESRWPIQSIRLVHRIGRVCAGQPSIVVEVTSTHRAEAFEACQFLIEEMKQRVPIWKQPLL